MIDHGKVSEEPLNLSAEDEARMLGPEGTDVHEHAKHHLGVDEDKVWTDPKRNKYPFAKEGRAHIPALHDIRNKAAENGHEDVKDAASMLLGHFKTKHKPDERSERSLTLVEILDPEERRIVKKTDGYHVMSEDGQKHLGGPYKTKEEALKRLGEVEYFKHEGKSQILSPEKRVLPFNFADFRVKDGGDGSDRKLVGYAAKFDKLSQNLGGFQEKINKGAFDEVLKTADVRGLRNHDPDKILARTASGTMRIGTDDVGLWYEMSFRNTQLWRDTLSDIESKDMDGSSFSFTADEKAGDDEWDETTNPPTRTLKRVRDLFDVGPVSYPAYLDTTAHARQCRSYQRFLASPAREEMNRIREEEEKKAAAQLRRKKILEFKLGLAPGFLTVTT
jgi:hypothetical protein